MEVANTKVNAARHEVRRILAGLEADGALIEWTRHSPERFRDGSPATIVVEFTPDGDNEVAVLLWSEATPGQQLQALKSAVRWLDSPEQGVSFIGAGLLIR